MGENEKARRAAKLDEDKKHRLYAYMYVVYFGCYCSGCVARRERLLNERRNGLEFPTQAEYEEYLQMKAEEAERRSHEAAQKRREEQEREAVERMKKEKEKAARIKAAEERKRAAKSKVKDERSKEAARRAREQQEKAAQLRMAKNHIKDQQEKFLRALEDRGEEVEDKEYVMDIGWTKKKGAAKCLFCEEEIKYYSFRCPDGGAIACNPCKNNMCRFTPPKPEPDPHTEEDGEQETATANGQDTTKSKVDNKDEDHDTTGINNHGPQDHADPPDLKK